MTNALKKTLVISPVPTHPQNAGNRARINNFLSSLKEKNCEIHFCYFDKENTCFHVKTGPDKKMMRKAWDKFIHVPVLPPHQLKMSAAYIVHAATPPLGNSRLTNSVLGQKLHRYCSFLATPSGLIFTFFQSISIYTNLVIKLLLYLRKKEHWSYYFLQSKYHLFRNRLKGKKISKDFLKDFFSPKYTKVENPADVINGPGIGSGIMEGHLTIDAWYNEGLDEIIKQLHASHLYTAVFVEYVFMSKALLNFDNSVLKIIDTHDLFTDRHLIYINAGISDTFFSTTHEEEARGLDRADLVIAIQDKERIQFQAMTKKQVMTVGHKIALAKPGSRVKHRYNILYVGSGNTSNIQGIQNFINNVFPRVTSSITNAVLLIAGDVCSHIDSTEGCRLLGEIRDIKYAYEQADLVINPGIIGTGLKIKTIEALGFSKPMVSTNHSVEGIDTYQNAFFTADTDEQFSDCIIKLLQNDNLYSEMSKNAFKAAHEYNQVIDRKLEQIMGICTTN